MEATPPPALASATLINHWRSTIALTPGVVTAAPSLMMITIPKVKRARERSSGILNVLAKAEIMKKKLGCAIPDLIAEDQTMEVESIGGRQQRIIPQRQLAAIIEARAEESLTLIRNHLHQQGVLEHLSSGIVFTGGAAQLKGFIEMAEYIFDCPVRIGIPMISDGLKDVVIDTAHAAGVGMLYWAYDNSLKKRRMNISLQSEALKNLKVKIKNLFLGSAD
jgi:cell division protein FtsA